MSVPQIICPFSRTGDEAAGNTPSEVLVNLAQGTRIALRFRCKWLRPAPDLWRGFPAVELTEQAKAAREYLVRVYDQHKPRKAQTIDRKMEGQIA